MKFTRMLVAAGCVAAWLNAAPAWAGSGVVTLYSCDGLREGSTNWYNTQFSAFTKATGIRVQYVEGGSGVVVNRLAEEKSNPQADVLVTFPPYMQEAAAEGLLRPYRPAAASHIAAVNEDPAHYWTVMVLDYLDFIYNDKVLAEPPASFAALLAPKFRNKVEYSTPGEAGDGSGVMLLINEIYGGREAGFAYMQKLQANVLGASSSTGRLTPLVNKGELWIANGDIQEDLAQMADNHNVMIFWPAGPDGVRRTVALAYYVALVKGAPHPEAGKKLIDFLLSRQAQSTLSSLADGIPVREDVHPTDANYEKLEALMQGVEIWTPDWAKVLAAFQADIAHWHAITGG